MEQVKIRSATLADILILVRHRRCMWWDIGDRDETALDLMAEAATEYFREALPQGSYHGVLAVNGNDEVVGGGGIVISKWPGVFAQREPNRAMILNLYVEPQYRRQGIAAKLMEAMIAWCKENNFASVGLHASDEGRPLYEHLGFKPTNEMRLDLTA
jgi:GNAT superfamily N-acetyltransferase